MTEIITALRRLRNLRDQVHNEMDEVWQGEQFKSVVHVLLKRTLDVFPVDRDCRNQTPARVKALLGVSADAKQKLGWVPESSPKKCAPRRSFTTWRKPKNIPCSNSMATTSK